VSRQRKAERPGEEADVEIGASASARRLRFRRRPKTEVETEGRTVIRSERGPEGIEVDAESGSKRRNLPEEVEPGVTYRDVEIGWVARARARASRAGKKETPRRERLG
jgi:hypothetical protein